MISSPVNIVSVYISARRSSIRLPKTSLTKNLKIKNSCPSVGRDAPKKSVMKSYLFLFMAAGLSSWFTTGCANNASSHTSPYHPGPVAGRSVGTAVGVVAGNAVGAGVGAVEGTAQGFAAPFDPSYRLVRHWATETTSDGRVIQVPIDVLVDKYGRPVDLPPPTGNIPGQHALPVQP